MELNGGGKKNNNAETTRRTELNIAEASASSLRDLTLGEGQSLGFRSLNQAPLLSPAVSMPQYFPTGADAESMQQMSSRAGENMNPMSYPERPGEPYCPYHLNNGYCRLGMHCKFNHPPRVPEGIGQPACQHYLETGKCNFGCKFHRDKYNPGIIRRYEFNALGYPLRSNATDCKFYLLHGCCKFGKTCIFNHPEPSNSMPWWLSRTTHSQTLYPVEPTSFNATHWQGPSSYAQVMPSGTTHSQTLYPVEPTSFNASSHWQGPSSHAQVMPSRTTHSQTLYPVEPTSFNARPHWQGPSSYAQVNLPRGLAQVPSSNTFPYHLNRQHNSGNVQFVGSGAAIMRPPANSENVQFVGSGAAMRPPANSRKVQFVGSGASMRPPANSGNVQFVGSGAAIMRPPANSGNVQFVGSGAAMRPPAASNSSFPMRPSEPDCPFLEITGKCKFGSGCRFNHPIELNPEGLPLRPGQPTCAFYGRNGFCGYGTSCKFDHPMAAPKGITDVPVVQQPLESSSEGSCSHPSW